MTLRSDFHHPTVSRAASSNGVGRRSSAASLAPESITNGLSH